MTPPAMKKNVILIDFENVQPDAIAALPHEHFEVLLFCGANQKKMDVALAASLQKLGEKVRYIQIASTGPNALDFHIAYTMGQLAERDPGAFFHIISRDKGFDPLIQYLKSQKILAARSESIQEIPLVKNCTLKKPTEQADAFIERLKGPKATKPKTEQTMIRAIKSHFQPDADDRRVSEILKAMVSTGFVAIEAGKIVYR